MVTSYINLFKYYKNLADKSMSHLSFKELQRQPNEQSNSISIIMKHIAGNMISRWTDIFTTDGEKSWRNRDGEFIDDFTSKDELLNYWEKGWKVLFDTLNSLKDSDLNSIIYIRNEGYKISEAIERQLAHYSYHIGQIVYVAKMYDTAWESLTIPLGKSETFNSEKFNKEKSVRHFTDNEDK